MARLAGGQDSPVFWPAVCSLSNVHLCWKCRVTWACSLCFLSCCCCRGGNFTCSAHAESKTHSVRFCSDPSDLISCHSTPGGTDGYFMAFFFFYMCSQNKQGYFSRGRMCEWWWDEDMETLNRKFLGLSGNVCSVIRVQVAQIQRLIVRFCLI